MKMISKVSLVQSWPVSAPIVILWWRMPMLFNRSGLGYGNYRCDRPDETASHSRIAPQTLTAIRTFVMAMILYPDVYKKAQAEIDRVIAQERLLDFDDRASLPYLECVMQEVLRCVSRLTTAMSVHLLTRAPEPFTDGTRLYR